MRIIIAGDGEVGKHLIKLLTAEGHAITLIDTNQELLDAATAHYDVNVVKGNATAFSVLQAAGIDHTDLFVAVTQSEEANLLACVIAKKLGVAKTVARIRNVEFREHRDLLDLKSFGVDEVISPDSLAAKEIERLLNVAQLTDIYDFGGGLLSGIGIHVTKTDGLNGKFVKDLMKPDSKQSFTAVAVLRDNHTLIPTDPAFRYRTNDHAYFIAQPAGVDFLTGLSDTGVSRINNVMVMGAGEVGYHVSKRLSSYYNVTLVDKDRSRCEVRAGELTEALVVCGDGRDVDFLNEENISETDAFIAVTGDAEINIMSCLVAKNHGVSKTIALVDNLDYTHLSQTLGVDTIINKKLIAANFISRYIRKGEVKSIATLQGVDAEVLEFVVTEGSRVDGKDLNKLKLPPGAIVGGVIRGGRGYNPRGSFSIEPDDHVVVFAESSAIRKTEELFQ
jgi:trk system potassium uptake protein TrkA